MLSNQKLVGGRKKYTLFDLFGDFGGFQSFVIFLPAQLMGFYASTMFDREIAMGMPVKGNEFQDRDGQSWIRAKKVVKASKNASGLRQKDVTRITEQVGGNEFAYLSYFGAFFRPFRRKHNNRLL